MPIGATQLELAGTAYSGIFAAGATDPWTAGIYYAKDSLGSPPMENADPEDEEMPITFFGVPGVGTKNGGFRGRDIECEMIAINSTLALCQTAKNALIAILKAGRFTVTVPGGTQRPSCKLKRAGAPEMGWMNIGGKVGLKFALKIRQMNNA